LIIKVSFSFNKPSSDDSWSVFLVKKLLSLCLSAVFLMLLCLVGRDNSEDPRYNLSARVNADHVCVA
jgi:hypothetical protein